MVQFNFFMPLYNKAPYVRKAVETSKIAAPSAIVIL